MPRKNLSINLHPTIPFRSSHLAIPPSPFTPRLPLTPTHPPPKKNHSSATSGYLAKSTTRALLPPPPSVPLHWVWQCHVCSRQYRLGVTRRCLEDGHYFCDGTTTVRIRDGSRRVKKHRACASEFDYKGWKKWGVWRRGVIAKIESAANGTRGGIDCDGDSEMRDVVAHADDDEDVFTPSVVSPLFGSSSSQGPAESRWFRSRASTASSSGSRRVAPARPKKDCSSRCDYPSECRWGKKYGVATPEAPTFSVAFDSTFLSGSLCDMAEEGMESSAGPADAAAPATTEAATGTAAPPTDFRDILTPEQLNVAETIDGVRITEASPLPFHPDDSCSSAPVSASGSSSASFETVHNPSAFADMASLVESARRRKSKTETMGPSPLASPDAAFHGSSSVSDSSSLPLSASAAAALPVRALEGLTFAERGNGHAVQVDEAHSHAGEGSKRSREQEFEFDFHKGMETVGGMIASVVGIVRGTTGASR